MTIWNSLVFIHTLLFFSSHIWLKNPLLYGVAAGGEENNTKNTTKHNKTKSHNVIWKLDAEFKRKMKETLFDKGLKEASVLSERIS